MNLPSVVVIVLRLMALDFLLRIAVQMTPEMLRYLQFYERSPLNSSPSVAPWFLLGGLCVSAVLLWVLAPAIARLATKGVSQDISLGAITLTDWYSIAFLGVGLFYISSHLPQVLNWSHYLFKAAASNSGQSWKEGIRGYDVSAAFIPFILGVVLFVKGRAWASVLARKQLESGSSSRPIAEHQPIPPTSPDPQ